MTTLTFSSEFTATRYALHRLAYYVVAPARKARSGRIGLRPTPGGFGTPSFPDGTRIAVRGAELLIERADPTRELGVPNTTDRATSITTLRAAASFVGIALSAQPDVGSDRPPFGPDEILTVDATESLALGQWLAFGADLLTELRGDVSEAQLWPEHFDLAVVVTLAGGRKVNVGFSPGDAYHQLPYAYVGPFSVTGLAGDYWNAPFGALLGTPSADAARAFIAEGLERLAP